MSLPAFSTQAELFSTAGLSGSLLAATDRYRLFAQKVYPALARVRAKLEACYCADNGRLAIEPVLWSPLDWWRDKAANAWTPPRCSGGSAG